MNWVKNSNFLQTSRENIAVVQHHDSITGTCRNHVAQDYMGRIEKAIHDTTQIEKECLSYLLDGESATRLKSLDLVILDAKEYEIMISNPLSNERYEVISFRSQSKSLEIKFEEQNIEHQVIPMPVFDGTNSEVFHVFFKMRLSGFSSRLIKVKVSNTQFVNSDMIKQNNLYILNSNGVKFPSLQSFELSKKKKFSIQNERYEISFNPSNGHISIIEELLTKFKHEFKDQFLQYETQRSGSYIFRTNSEASILFI
jgi:hypothetical protein